MRKLPVRVTLLIGLFTCLLNAIPAQAQQYPIKFERPVKIGDKFSVKGSASHEASMVVVVGETEKPVKAESSSVSYDGDEEILKVNDLDNTMRVKFTFVRSTIRTEEGEKELLPKGSIVFAETREHEAEYELVGGTVSPELKAALELMHLVNSSADDVSDDEMMGSSQKQGVGDSWPINTSAVSRIFHADNGKTVKGTVKLTGLEVIDDVPGLELSGQMTGDDLKPAIPDLPPGAKIESFSMKATMFGMFPLDLELPPMSLSMTLVGEGRMLIPMADGALAVVKASTSESHYEEVRRFGFVPKVFNPENFLDLAGYTYRKASDRAWIATFTGDSMPKVEVVIAPAEGLVVLVAIVAPKASLDVTPEMLLKLLNLTRAIDRIKITFTNEGSLTVRLDSPSRLLDFEEFKSDVELVAYATDRVHSEIKSFLKTVAPK